MLTRTNCTIRKLYHLSSLNNVINNVSKNKRNLHIINPDNRPVIVSAVRTPIGGYGGKLSSMSAVELGTLAVRSSLEKANLTNDKVQEVILGNVISANLGQAPARQVAIHAGMSKDTICTTINKVCSSGLKSVMLASQSIMLGINDTVVAGGFESMSNAPYYVGKARFGYRLGDSTLIDGMNRDGLDSAYDNKPMGVAAEKLAKTMNISREEQDKHAAESYRRAIWATENGLFKEEIVPILIPQKGQTLLVDHDEDIYKVKYDKIPQLKPAFLKENGTITAASSSNLSDGAASLVIMSQARAKKGGYKILGRILGFGDAEREPDEFAIAPSDAIPKALKHAGVNKSDVQYWEFNEAFSVVVLANARILDLDLEKVNIHGGAVSIGHPLGASGARILVTLLNVLKRKNASIGVVAICNGGGGGSSLVISRE
jgi:acetyl-CoA C-acetyltransferase